MLLKTGENIMNIQLISQNYQTGYAKIFVALAILKL